MADTRDTLLTGEEFEALNAFGTSERVGRRKIYFWMWARLYLLVVLLTFRALLAIFFPEQFAISYAFDQEHYYSVALFRLCLFSPMVAAYLYCLNKRIFFVGGFSYCCGCFGSMDMAGSRVDLAFVASKLDFSCVSDVYANSVLMLGDFKLSRCSVIGQKSKLIRFRYVLFGCRERLL